VAAAFHDPAALAAGMLSESAEPVVITGGLDGSRRLRGFLVSAVAADVAAAYRPGPYRRLRRSSGATFF